MRVLEDDAQAAAEGVLLDVPHVDAVIEHPPALYVVEAVDEVGDGGLARAGGAHEGDLLPRLGIEAHILEDGVAGLVAEIHMFKAHVPPERDQRAVRPLPCPAPRPLCAGDQAAVLLVDVYQVGAALVHLWGLVHDLKDPLRAGQGGPGGSWTAG